MNTEGYSVSSASPDLTIDGSVISELPGEVDGRASCELILPALTLCPPVTGPRRVASENGSLAMLGVPPTNYHLGAGKKDRLSVPDDLGGYLVSLRMVFIVHLPFINT